MKLHLQSMQLGLRELGFELECAQLPFAEAPVITECIKAHSDQQVDTNSFAEICDHEICHAFKRKWPA